MSAKNRFEKHPVLTAVFFSLFFFFLMDFVSAKIFKAVYGYSFTHKALKDALKIEKLYRISSPVYHHDLASDKDIPNARYGRFTYHIFTNSLGFKDKAVRHVPLVSDRYRLLFIGDSFTEGIGYNYEDSFVGVIDKNLTSQGVEVFNAGVCSYSPVIYWKKVEYLLETKKFRFDELIVFVDMSDIEDEAEVYGLDEKSNVIVLKELPLDSILAKLFLVRVDKNTIKRLVDENSIVTVSFLKWLYARTFLSSENKEPCARSSWTTDTALYKKFGQRGLEKSAVSMSRLLAVLKKHHIRMTLAVYPWPSQIYDNDFDSIQVRFWRDWCVENNVFFLNCFPYFGEGEDLKERCLLIDRDYILGDFHWSRQGHAKVAKIFLDFYARERAQEKTGAQH